MEKVDDSYAAPQKVIVEVETQIKGKLKQRVELFIDRTCYTSVYEKQRYIFTARQVKKDNFSGLFSEKWSLDINSQYSEADINEIIQEIQSAIKKEKQPSLRGAVVEQDSGVKERYMIATRGIKQKFAPDYLRPLADVTVTAKAKDGQIFTSSTDDEGEFVFEDLPFGTYEIYTNLPKDYNVRSETLSPIFEENGKKFFVIREQLCSHRVTFNAQLQGQVEVKIKSASKEKDSMVLSLWRVSSNGKAPEIVEWFYDAPKLNVLAEDGNSSDLAHTFTNVPVGDYVVMVSVLDSPLWAEGQFFYPGTKDWKSAEIIKVERGKTFKITFAPQE